MFARWTIARQDLRTMNQLLPAAERLAHEQGSSTPGAEHLVAAALDLPDRIAADLFAEHGLDRDRWLEAVRQEHQRTLAGLGIDVDLSELAAAQPPPRAAGPLRSQESLREVFGRAVDHAKGRRRALHSGDVLAGALHATDGTVARTVRSLGLDRDALLRRLQS